MKCSEQLFITMPWGEHRLVMGFLFSNLVELRFKIAKDQVVSPWVAQMETQRKFAKSSMKTDRVPFW
jgi:hypothetical protein